MILPVVTNDPDSTYLIYRPTQVHHVHVLFKRRLGVLQQREPVMGPRHGGLLQSSALAAQQIRFAFCVRCDANQDQGLRTYTTLPTYLTHNLVRIILQAW